MHTVQGQTLSIRDEIETDYEAITEITKAAFETVPVSRQTEHFIIKALRADNALTLSIVAEMNGKVVGHMASSAVSFSYGYEGWEGLGPLSVQPDCQSSGIGSALMRECLTRLKAVGAKGCVLVGDPGYYERFGFASWPDLTHEGVPQEYVMALAFGDERARGQVSFHPGFAATE